MNYINQELSEICKKNNVDFEVLDKDKSKLYIQDIFTKYDVLKKDGHLSIGIDIVSVPTEKYELSYFEILNAEPAYIFFDQQNYLKRNEVIRINNARQLGEILGECFGFEYFLSNELKSFLISVNWYAIEMTGDLKERLLSLEKDNDKTTKF